MQKSSAGGTKAEKGEAEKRLWEAVLSRNQVGIRFLRQRPIDRFIVDFFAPEIKLIVEVDGSSHLDQGNHDRYREDRLRSLGYELIRFTEGNVLNNLDEIVAAIRHTIHCQKSTQAPSPNPSRRET